MLLSPCFEFYIKCNSVIKLKQMEMQIRSLDIDRYLSVILSCLMWMCLSALLLLLHIQFMYDPERLEELVEVDAAVLVEIDAPCHVINGSVVHIHTQVRTEEFPCLPELLDGNLTCKRWNRHPLTMNSNTHNGIMGWMRIVGWWKEWTRAKHLGMLGNQC